MMTPQLNLGYFENIANKLKKSGIIMSTICWEKQKAKLDRRQRGTQQYRLCLSYPFIKGHELAYPNFNGNRSSNLKLGYFENIANKLQKSCHHYVYNMLGKAKKLNLIGDRGEHISTGYVCHTLSLKFRK